MTYTRANNLAGWSVFLTALVTYLLTMAPTASFWDVGEFIATANELEVPHPPGAPLFLMLGRLFAMFAPDVTLVAWMVNLLSVVCSAALAMLICWTTTMLARKVLAPGNAEPDSTARSIILWSGIVAGLTTTFLDTVWFNAVEAEVYAASSFFTALVFWLMLKWEARADEPGHLRWIILIAYMIGLSVGVHLLPLLTIPALVIIYYFRKYQFSWGGLIVALLIGGAILGFVQVGVIQKTWDLAWSLELQFTGTVDAQGNNPKGWGLPYGTGTSFLIFLLVGGLVAGIWWSHKQGRVALNVSLISAFLIYLGFSSYAMIAIRSNADPAIDQNHPGNLNNFLSYLKREQYGQMPLLRGPMYNSQVTGYKDLGPYYFKRDGFDRYIAEGNKQEYEYDQRSLRIFPRMHSRDHYRSGPFGYSNYVRDKGADPNSPEDDRPSGLDNLRFFFDYQIGHMYVRYLLWNFVGRESDLQHASWESGFNFGELKAAPKELREHPSRNHYFYLPLLLGLLGLSWQIQFDPKRAAVVGMLFLFTGLFIVIYLNQVAQEPRERDYAFVGSYHTFAIWVGLGVAGLAELVRRFLGRHTGTAAGIVAVLAVPALLAAQNWHDHDRHGHFVPPDSAYNLLNSCEPNAILFTNGDNDTFPLWYLQEVEGIRTDVRVVNLSLLNTDWYIHQLKTKQWNESVPLPISVTEDFYMGERNGAVPFRGNTFAVPVDRTAILSQGLVSKDDEARIVSPMPVTVRPRGSAQNGYLMKQDLLILDMVLTNAQQGWKRPIYFANTVGSDNYVGLEPYFELQGLAYRIVPVLDTTANNQGGRLNLPKMYENVMEKFRLRGLNDSNVYYGENIERMVSNFRSTFFRLASGYQEAAERLEAEYPGAPTRAGGTEVKRPEAVQQQIDEYKRRAGEVMQYGQNSISDQAIPHTASSLYLTAFMNQRIGRTAQADSLFQLLQRRGAERIRFYNQYPSTISDADEWRYFLDRVLEFQITEGQYQKALQSARDLFAATGEQRYQQMAQQIQQGLQQDSTARPGAGPGR